MQFEHLYIHIPFCFSKCDYCAFHSVTDRRNVISFFKKIEREFVSASTICNSLKTVYIGGGTPTSLSENELEKLFHLIKKYFMLDTDCEISIECNPETLTLSKLNIISAHVNRISIGVQSFNINHRKTIGRSGDIKNIYKSLELISASKIKNISSDFIYGIPGQTLLDFEADINEINKFEMKHISAYSLTYEEGTKLAGALLKETAVKEDIELYVEKIFKKYGFSRYEISNFAKKGYECRHNYEIWFGSNYLGIGPTATSFDGINRWTEPMLNHWLNNLSPEIDEISVELRFKEIFIMGLRTVNGWRVVENFSDVKTKIFSKLGNEVTINKAIWERIKNPLISLQENKLISFKKTSKLLIVKATKKGLLFWNEIASEII